MCPCNLTLEIENPPPSQSSRFVGFGRNCPPAGMGSELHSDPSCAACGMDRSSKSNDTIGARLDVDIP